MSSLDTLITNWLSKEEQDAVEKVLLDNWTDYVVKHGGFIAAMVKTSYWKYDILYRECIEALKAAGCSEFEIDRFQIAMICDDDPHDVVYWNHERKAPSLEG